MVRNTIPPSRKGIPHSEETKKRISESCKARGIGKWMIGKNHTEETKAKIKKNNAKYWLGKTAQLHAHWKDARINPLYLTIRQCFKYRQWRSSIYKRDEYACVLCKKKASGMLEADHYPKQFIEILNEFKIDSLEKAIDCDPLWDINNGRTLCKDCHNPTRGRRPHLK